MWKAASPLQGRQRHEGGGAARRGLGDRRLLGVEAIDAAAQLPLLVAQLPVRLGQPFEAPGEAACPDPRGEGHEKRGNREQPEESHQTLYLIERLATVSTA